jgi:hypothetical protein
VARGRTAPIVARRDRFDDGPLVALQQRVVLDDLREHLVHVGAEPILLCVARWRDSSHVLDESGSVR